MPAGSGFLSLRQRVTAGALATTRALPCSGAQGWDLSLFQARTASNTVKALPKEMSRIRVMPVLDHYIPRRTILSPMSKSFYRDLQGRARSLWWTTYFYHLLSKINRNAGLPKLSLKDEVMTTYTMMNDAYARGDVATLKNVCTHDNYNTLCDRLRKRAPGYTYNFEITNVSRKPAIVSILLSNMSTEKEATYYVQVVARIRTTQVLTVKDSKGHPVGKDRNEPKEVDEFVLFSRWYGPLPPVVSHPGGWAVQGKLGESL